MRQAHTHTNSILTLFCEICNTKEDFIFLRNKGICQICDIGKTEVKKVKRRSKIGLTYSGRTMRCIVTNAKCLSRFVITTPRAPDAVRLGNAPTKNGLIPPSSRSKVILVRSHSYAPSFRGFRLDTASAPSLKSRCNKKMSLCGNNEASATIYLYPVTTQRITHPLQHICKYNTYRHPSIRLNFDFNS